MREMKNSGVEWIGKIPDDWQISRIGNHFYFYSGDSLTNESIDENGEYPVYGANGIRGYYNKYNLQGKNILLGRVGALCGNVHLTNEPIWVTEHALVVVSFTESIEIEYAKYLFEAMKLSQYSRASAQPVISSDVLRQLRIPLPIISNQIRISDYLDKKCSKIDSIIEKQQKIIEKLKEYKLSIITEAVTKGLNPDVEMVDSFVDGVGKIPVNSIPTKLKYICNTQGRIGFKGYTTADLVDEGEGAITLGATQLKNGVIDLSEPTFISWEKYYESPEIMVKKNDVLIVQRGTIGKTAIVDNDYGKVTINPSLVLINKIKINCKYLLYALSARYIQDNIKLIGTTTAIPMISQKQINDLIIIVPMTNDQNRIVKYLDSMCFFIDNKIDRFSEVINKMYDYKKSLIYEVVTGKKEV